MTAITVSVNGEPWPAPPRATVADLVAERSASAQGIAVACNGEVVPRSRWSETRVREGDEIEIVTAAAGG